MRASHLLIPFILLAPVYGQSPDVPEPAKAENPATEHPAVDLSKLPMHGGWTYGELMNKAQTGDYKANMLLGYYWMNAAYRPCKNIADHKSPYIQETLNNLHGFFEAAAKANPTHPAPKLLLTDPCGILGIFKGKAMLAEHEQWLSDCKKLAAKGDEDAITALICVTDPTTEDIKKLIEPIRKKADHGNQSALVALSKIRVGLLNEDPSAVLPTLEKHRKNAGMELLFHLGMHDATLMHEEKDAAKKEEYKQKLIQSLKPLADQGHASAMVVLTSLQAGPSCDYTAQLRHRGDIQLLLAQLNENKRIHPAEADAVKRFLPSEYAARSAVELAKAGPDRENDLNAVIQNLISLNDERGVPYMKEPYSLPLKQVNKLSPQAKTHKELTLAAQIGSVTSCLQLGELWRNEFILHADYLPMALEADTNMSIWYRMASEEEHPLAKLRLIQLDLPNPMELPKSEEASKLLKECTKLASEGDFLTLKAIVEYLGLNQDEWQQLTLTLRTQALNNDARAQANLAYLLLFSYASNDDTYAEGLRWARLSAIQGNPCGMYVLGRALTYEFGIEDRTTEGWAWLYRAALKGHVSATELWCDFTSICPSEDNAIFHGLAERGHIPSLIFLAEAKAYPTMPDVAQTDEEAEAKHHEDLDKTGEMPDDSELPPWMNEAALKNAATPLKLNPEAIRLWGKAGELGSMTALDEMCTYYEKVAMGEQDPAMRQQLLTSAVSATTVLAKKGDPRGLMRLARFYKEGIGVQKSIDLYRDYVLKAAETGAPNALVEKARMLLKGDGVESAPKEALSILLKLEPNHSPNVKELYFLLGYMYEEGLGTDRNTDKAYSYYLLGTEEDDDKAMNNLAAMYESGNGINVNLKEAQKWYAEAAKLGNKQAKANYERVTDKLNKERGEGSEEEAEAAENSAEESASAEENSETAE